MSFDLYFQSKAGSLSFEAFSAYFKGRQNYTLENSGVYYENEQTDVSFTIAYQEDTLELDELSEFVSQGSLNINYLRPFYYILEIEPEFTAFVKHFDLAVYDPQAGGEPGHTYSSKALTRSWALNNKAAVQAMIQQRPQGFDRFSSLPQQTLVETWQWNLKKHELQKQLTDDIFVAKVMIAEYEGKTVTVAVWPDGIPIMTMPVDYLYVDRDQLAVRRFFSGKRKDQVLIPWQEALPLFSKHGSIDDNGVVTLGYQKPPAEMVKFIQSFKPGRNEKSVTQINSLVDEENIKPGFGSH